MKNTDGLNIPRPRLSPEKPIDTHFCIPLLLAWQFWGGGVKNFTAGGTPAEYKHPKTKFLLLTIPWRLLGNNFAQDGVDTTSKWPSQISFLSPNTLVNLCTKQSLPPAYSRLLWVRAPSSPSQGGDQAPSSILLGGFLLTWALSSPAAVHYLLTWKVQALRSRILPEVWGTFPPLEDSSCKTSE